MRARTLLPVAFVCLLATLPLAVGAQEIDLDLPGLPALTATPAPNGGTLYSLPVQTLLLLTLLSFIPAMVLMMTSFTRIIIVFALMRQAMGTQTSPP
ncbi:MAG: flagellar biosynthetic protein FliP, partial [Betaproteobacteria bacterium]|nr:flagellar biosynthetic protein FliP [Betaproteobacteria bacterium]